MSARGVAAQLGISERTVGYRTLEYGWQAERDRVREAFSTIRIDLFPPRAELPGRCMNSLNPQDAFALVSLESAAVKHGTAAGNRSDPPPDDPREISSTEDVIAALGTMR